MAIISELEEHIGNSSPDARRILAKTANTMSEAQQRDFLASLQMMDIEFQMEVAPYLPKGSKINPSAARLKTFPPEAGVSPKGLNYRGFSTKEVPAGDASLTRTYGGYSVQLEPDTVNVLEASSARGPIWGHEYRHHEGIDSGPFRSRLQATRQRASFELLNYVQDVMASQNKKALAANVRNLARQVGRVQFPEGFETEGDTEELQAYMDAHNATLAKNGDGTAEEIARATRKLLSSPLLSRLISGPGKDLPNAALGSYYKRVVLGDIEMPEDYREGGRTRLI